MDRIKKILMLFIGLVLVVVLAACGDKDTDPSGEDTANPPESQQPEPDQEPPLRLAEGEIVISVNFSEEDFKRRYVELINREFPHVKVTQLRTTADFTFRDVVATNTQMDIIDQGITNLDSITDLQLPSDLDPLIRDHNIDLNRFDPFILEDIRSYGANGELFILPYTIQPFVLHYNKGIFDMFGVEYPEANNTWDELIEMTRRLSRTEDGVHYRGLHAGINVNRLQTQLSLPFVDAVSKQGAISSTPGWTKLLEIYSRIYSIPGNFPEGATVGDGNAAFIDRKTLAMFPHLLSIHNSAWVTAAENGMEIGVTTYPVFADAPGIGTGLFGGGLAISFTTKQPELAMEIIKYYTSDEVQKELGKLGLVTPLVSPEVRNSLFDGNPLKDRLDIDVLYHNQIAAPYPKTKWDIDARNIVQRNLQNFALGRIDMNTLMRQLDEEINQVIASKP